MGGLVLDVLVIFLVRLAVFRWRLYKGRNWPIIDAVIVESEVQRKYGGSDLHLAFRFSNTHGEFVYADYYIAYWSETSASEKWKRFRPEMQVRIRFNPSDPTQVNLDRNLLA